MKAPLAVLLLLGVAVVRAVPAAEGDEAKPHALTPREAADGWLLLFDGATTFGWKVEGDAKVQGGVLVLGDAFQPATPALGARYRQLTAEEFERQGIVETPAYAEYRSRNSQPSGGASTHLQKYLQWMQQAGLSNVDCVWKHFARAVVYGERPTEA